jgi:DNA-binding transcriptional regulator YbjK
MSRRTTQTPGRQQQQQRTPQPSIKSSQVFSSQPTREQTQYQQMNAKKQLQQQQLQQQPQMRNYPEEYGEKENVRGVTKITVAQAITLITLRLGSIETKIMNGELGLSNNNNDNNIDSESLINVSNRLDALEAKINLSSSTDYKQQIDHLTQAIIQSKNMSNSFAKENKELKTQLTNLKKELSDVKELIEMVKNMAVSNENKIFQMLNVSNDLQMNDQLEISTENEADFNLSDSEHSILETDIRQTLEENNENNEELQITTIDNL